MESDARIAQLLDEATAGLKGDRELRLDVRAELASHIEEAIAAHRAEGKSEQESLALALRSFGPAADIAGALLVANRRRMRLRAVARFAACALLLPAAVVIAAIVCSRIVLLSGAVSAVLTLCSDGWLGPGPRTTMDRMIDSLPQQEAFLFRGDTSRPTRSAQQRAIWEAHPERKAYYGNYITHVLQEYKDQNWANEYKWSDEREAAFRVLERELRRGEALDPGNARYNLLLAGLWLEKACDDYRKTLHRGADGPLVYGLEWDKLIVRDRALLDRAMAEVRKAARKPYKKTYATDMLTERLALLPPVRRIEDHLARLDWRGGLLLPDLAYDRRILWAIPRYGQLLAAEGRAAETETFLQLWLPVSLKLHEDASAFVESANAFMSMKIGAEDSAAAYEQLGRPDKAGDIRRRAQRLFRPYQEWLDYRGSPAASQFWRELKLSGSLLDKALGLYTMAPSEDLLAPGRELEHVLLEQAGVSLCVLVLLGLMLGAAIAALRWRWARDMSSAPLLVLPNWKQMLCILALGVLLPLAAFYAYTRWSGLAGREYSVRYLGHRFILELLLLSVTIAVLSHSLAAGAIRRRCESLGVPVPRGAGRCFRAAGWLFLGLLWTGAFRLRGDLRWAQRLARFVEGSEPFVWGTAWLAGALAVYVGLRGAFRSREHGVYRGTVARSLIPVFAAAMLMLVATVHPYLRARETALVRECCALTADSDTLGFSRAEARLVAGFRAEVRTAAAELEAESRAPSEGVEHR